MRRARALPVVAGVALLAVAPTALANELDDFQQARAAYEEGEYATAAERFAALLAGDPPQIENRALRLESRKYLAASRLFLGDREAARAQIRKLLEDDPTYVLDPLAFPAEMQELFASVKARVQEEREAEQRAQEQAEAEARRRQMDELLRERARMEALAELAARERVERHRSRWVALLPFGIGQFQNGHDTLGTVLAVTEGALLAVNITTFFLHRHLEGQQPAPDNVGDAQLAERAFRIGNQVSLGLLLAVAAAGILDAQLRFEPVEVEERERPLPADLQVRLGAGGLQVSGRF